MKRHHWTEIPQAAREAQVARETAQVGEEAEEAEEGRKHGGSTGSTGSGAPKPKPTKAPSPAPVTTAAPKPQGAPAPAASEAPSSPVVQDSSGQPAVEPDKAADALTEASGGASGPVDDLIGNAADPADDAAESPDAESAQQQAASDEAAAAGNHSGHGEHSGSSHAEEGEHDHAGGLGLMAALRVLDILAGVILAGMMFFRYVIWRDEKDEAPFGFSLRAERLFIGAAALIWILSGVTRLSMLSDQFGGASIYMLASGTMIGKVATLRPALALFALLLAFAPNRERLWANRIKFAAAEALIVTFPLTGHAYAAVKDAALAVALHTVHMCAAAIWFGGLAGLLSLTFYRNAMDRLNQAAVRFSIWALPSTVIILVSGIWLSAARLSAWGQLVSIAYGKLIMAKAFFTLLVLAIAALHKLVFMPQIAKASAERGLLLGVRIEICWQSHCSCSQAGCLRRRPGYRCRANAARADLLACDEGKSAYEPTNLCSRRSGGQAPRLDVWLLKQGRRSRLLLLYQLIQMLLKKRSVKIVTIPLELRPAAAELFEYPGSPSTRIWHPAGSSTINRAVQFGRRNRRKRRKLPLRAENRRAIWRNDRTRILAGPPGTVKGCSGRDTSTSTANRSAPPS